MPWARRALPSGGVVRVFLLAFVIYAYFMPRWADWNIDSRLDLSHAIVTDHSLRIDRYHYNTWDKAVYKGHYYSDKAPGTAVMGAAVYGGFVLARATPLLGGAIRELEHNSAWNTAIVLGRTDTQKAPAAKGRVLGGCQRSGSGNVQTIPWGNRLYPPFQDWALSKYVVTIGVDALLSALFVAFFFWFLGFFVAGIAIRLVLTALYGLATAALPYSTVFYSHQPVAAFLFTAFALIFLRSRSRVGSWAIPAAGFLLGLALFTEYTVALIIALLGLYALWMFRRSPSAIAGLCAAGSVPVLALFAYNYLTFGNPLDTGYSHDFCWSAAQAAGYAGFTSVQLGPLFDLTLGPYRGLFFMSPFLLLTIPGAWIMARRGYGVEAIVSLASGAALILAISAYWGWNGGQVDGPRYLVPCVPFLAFPVLFFLDSGRRIVVRSLIAATALWSVVVTWSLFLGGDTFPTSWLRNPLTMYSWPNLAGNHIAPNAGYFLGLRGWPSLLPLVFVIILLAGWPMQQRRTSVQPSSLASDPTAPA